MPTLEEIMKSCLAPIGEEEPNGVDAKYEPEYMAAHEEISKITSGGGTDWEKVVENSTQVLINISKDLNVAGYLCLGLFKTNGYEGLNKGLEGYMGILEHFDYFPKNKNKNKSKTQKMRSAAIEWLNMRLSEFIEAFPPENNPEDAGSVIAGFDRLRQINEWISETFLPPPSLSKFLQVLGGYRSYAIERVGNQQTPKNSPVKHEKKQSEKEAAQKISREDEKKTEEKVPSPESASVIPDNTKDPMVLLGAVAGALRGKNLSDPVSYRVMRIAKWEGIKNFPPANAEGRTFIPGPRPEAITAVRNIFDSPDPLVTIRVCENAFSDYGIWWLDLQRSIIFAMERSGSVFDRARNAVLGELTGLMVRFPKIAGLQFADGTPFADEETSILIDSLETDAAGGSERMGPVDSPMDDELNQVLAEADETGKKDVGKALALLQKYVNKIVDQRSIFYCRLCAGTLCLKNNRIKEAMVILEDLYCQSSGIHLRQWDAGFYHNLCVVLDKVYRRAGKGVSMDKWRGIHEEVLRYDLGYQLTGK